MADVECDDGRDAITVGADVGSNCRVEVKGASDQGCQGEDEVVGLRGVASQRREEVHAEFFAWGMNGMV